jgi:hypothetical protein
MPNMRKALRKMEGNVHTGSLGRLTGADLPDAMYLGPQNRIAGIRTPQRSDVPGIALPRGNEVRSPKRGKLNRFG